MTEQEIAIANMGDPVERAYRAAYAAGAASVPSGEPVAWLYSPRSGPLLSMERMEGLVGEMPLYAATGEKK